MTRIHQPESGLRATDPQRRMYRDMLLAREPNDRVLTLNRQGRAAFAMPGTGHEAARVGSEPARELRDPGERARARTLTRVELIDATLTIDNTGACGSLISQPIVPLGQVAIVTTEASRRELRSVPGDDGGDAFAPCSVMNLAISFDHRALDGAEAGALMAALKASLEAIGPDDPLDRGAAP